MHKFFLHICLLVFAKSIISYANTSPDVPLRYLVDRLSLSLIGLPATEEQMQSFENGEKTLSDIANQLRSHPRFETRLMEFWAQRMKISSNVDYVNLFSIPSGYDDAYPEDNPRKLEVTLRSQMAFGRYGRGDRFTIVSKRYTKCSDVSNGRFDSIITNVGDCRCGGLYGSEVETRDVNGEAVPYPTAVTIVPWWNRQSIIATCSSDIQADRCGPNLRNCMPYKFSINSQDNVLADIGTAISLEPAAMAAKFITEDKDWRKIMTTTKGVINGTYYYMLANPEWSKLIREISPPNSYQNVTNHPMHATIMANPGNKNLVEPLSEDPYQVPNEYFWIERGSNHAGILTTPGFHMTNNGNRALANSVRSQFLCREFVVPEGVKQVVSDETDLTKKPYCSSCHITLEPFAKFFNRWPANGDLSYYYKRNEHYRDNRGATLLDENNNPVPIDDLGTYSTGSGNGLLALGEILSKEEDLNQCAVKQAFNFLVGREMNQEELVNMLPALRNKFVNSGYKVWPVMIEILNTKSFLGVTLEGKRQ